LRIIVGVSGASGSIYGFRLLEKLRARPGVEIHLILSRAAERTAHLEMQRPASDFKKLADQVHSFEDIGSRLASGSFLTDGMVIAPCSIQSMSSIACGVTSNLLLRAADVCLKERRRLILLVRETPFHLGHLRTMVSLTEMGAIIAPPIPGFYHNPQTILDLVDHTVDRVLDLLHISSPEARRWDGRRAVIEPTAGNDES
jgi:4-hydroxy-3-polyprenylbenzoate decarboxylase